MKAWRIKCTIGTTLFVIAHSFGEAQTIVERINWLLGRKL